MRAKVEFEMPENCAECPIAYPHTGGVYKCVYLREPVVEHFDRRDINCPLEPVPEFAEYHGDLPARDWTERNGRVEILDRSEFTQGAEDRRKVYERLGYVWDKYTAVWVAPKTEPDKYYFCPPDCAKVVDCDHPYVACPDYVQGSGLSADKLSAREWEAMYLEACAERDDALKHYRKYESAWNELGIRMTDIRRERDTLQAELDALKNKPIDWRERLAEMLNYCESIYDSLEYSGCGMSRCDIYNILGHPCTNSMPMNWAIKPPEPEKPVYAFGDKVRVKKDGTVAVIVATAEFRGRNEPEYRIAYQTGTYPGRWYTALITADELEKVEGGGQE